MDFDNGNLDMTQNLLDLPVLVLMTILAFLDMETLFALAQTCATMYGIIDDNKRAILRSKSHLDTPAVHAFIMANYEVNTMADFWVVLRLLEFQPQSKYGDYIIEFSKDMILDFDPTRIAALRHLSECQLLNPYFFYLDPVLAGWFGEKFNLAAERETFVRLMYIKEHDIRVKSYYSEDVDYDRTTTIDRAYLNLALSFNMAYVQALELYVNSESNMYCYDTVFWRGIHRMYEHRLDGETAARIQAFRDGINSLYTLPVKDLHMVGFDIDRLCEP
jgi:hypothetical protein